MPLLVAFASLDCASAPHEATGSLDVTTTSATGLSQKGAARISVAVTGPGLASPIVITEPLAGELWQQRIEAIPTGVRAVHIETFNAANVRLSQADVEPIPINVGKTAAVAVTLQPLDAAMAIGDPPRIDALVATSSVAEPGAPVELRIETSSADPAESLRYTWWASDGTFNATDSPFSQWTAPSLAGPQTVSVQIANAQGVTATTSMTLAAAHASGSASVTAKFNTWPVVQRMNASLTRLDVGQNTTLSVVATDPDSDRLSYAWSATCAGTFSNPTAANPTFSLLTLPPSGSCGLIATVADGRGGQTSGTLSLQTGSGAVVNFAPQIDSTFQSLTTLAGGEQVIARVVAHDPEGTPIAFQWSAKKGVLSAPRNANGTSEVTWTAPKCTGRGATWTVTATVTDGGGVSTTCPLVMACR